MSQSFFFYDLETSGFSPKEARIMQFGGQRTDLMLKPIGQPVEVFIRLTPDVLPDPDAALVTGITPQQTLAEGLSEAEFLQLFYTQIATAGTIFVGYNSIRFDDEFMRYLNYRNFYDPYEWQWQDERSKWDLLDVVRMMRALRPDGINWPVDSAGKPSNRLELLTSANKISHLSAHTALADVKAVIELAQLIRSKQPKLFDYLLNLRDKKKVATLVNNGQLFVYTSGRFPGEYQKTAIVGNIADYPDKQGVLVWDLRHNCQEFIKMTEAQIIEALSWSRDYEGPRLPVKLLRFNRCPAIAPLSVLTAQNLTNLDLDPKKSAENYDKLIASDLPAKIIKAMKNQEKLLQARFLEDSSDVDNRLYDGFFGDGDKQSMQEVRTAQADELKALNPKFMDGRLQALLPLYKARNFPKSLDQEDQQIWETFRERKLLGGKTASRAAKFFVRLEELKSQAGLSDNQQFILEELRLYAESILPIEPA